MHKSKKWPSKNKIILKDTELENKIVKMQTQETWFSSPPVEK